MPRISRHAPSSTWRKKKINRQNLATLMLFWKTQTHNIFICIHSQDDSPNHSSPHVDSIDSLGQTGCVWLLRTKPVGHRIPLYDEESLGVGFGRAGVVLAETIPGSHIWYKSNDPLDFCDSFRTPLYNHTTIDDVGSRRVCSRHRCCCCGCSRCCGRRRSGAPPYDALDSPPCSKGTAIEGDS